jgi:hypothetical protein
VNMIAAQLLVDQRVDDTRCSSELLLVKTFEQSVRAKSDRVLQLCMVNVQQYDGRVDGHTNTIEICS